MNRIRFEFAAIAIFGLLTAGCPSGGGSDPPSSSDTLAPTVGSTQPVDGATNVAINTVISVLFTEPMDGSTITLSTFTLSSGGTAVTGTVAYSGKTATFTPSANLSPNTPYTGTITTGAKDPAGNPLTADFTWKFTTGVGTDVTPPTVLSTHPANTTADVVLNSSISATFSEPMDPSTLTTATFTVSAGGSPIAGTVNSSGATATFTPSANLASTTVYTATITTGAKDLAGNPLAADYTWQFTTGGALDTTAPTVISTTPANNATNLPLNTTISATFSEAMDPSTLTTTTFTVSTGGSPIAGAVGYSGTAATFTPASGLTLGSSYTATITTGAKDLAGNPLAANYDWQFGMLAKPDLCVTPTGGGPNSCYAKIMDALAAATTGNIIGVAAGTYTEYVVIDKTVTLEGGWDLAFTALDPVANVTKIQPPDSTFSVVWIDGNIADTSAVAPTLDGFTITGGGGGNHGGGLRITDSNAVVRNNIIKNNTAFLFGGGIWVQRGAPRIENNTIKNNIVNTDNAIGGGVSLEGTQATLIGNVIDANTIDAKIGYGGGIGINGGGPVTLTNNTITNNAAANQAGVATDIAYGGGVSIDGATANLTGNLIQGNSANSVFASGFGGGYGYGGGVYIINSTAFTLTNNTIDNNIASYKYYVYPLGGGVLIDSSQGLLSGNVISNNMANGNNLFGNGGGIASVSSTLTIQGGQIINNKTAINYEGYGGGLYAKSSTITLNATLVQGNGAGNTPFYGMGGGLAFIDSPYTLTNAVIADNITFYNDTAVGGIFSGLSASILTNNSPGVLVNNTVANNKGQGVNIAAATTLVNNIITGQTTGVKLSGAGPVAAKNNDFYNNTTNTGGFSLDLSDIVINPQLTADYHLTAPSPVQDQGTHGPVVKAGSATETVDIPATDFDGESRAMIGPSGLYKVDIGADEFTGTAQRIVDLDAGAADLTVIGPGGDPDLAKNAAANDWIGYAVLADDVNGDGKADLVTAAEDFSIDPDNAPFTPGRLFGVFNSGTRNTGTMDLLDTPADLIVDTEMTLQHIGSALTGGDLNGDGKRDLIAGSYQDDGAGGGAVWPTVFVFWGSSSLTGSRLLDGTHPADFELRAPGQDFFAFSSKNALTTADLNADGKTDLIVGDGLADDGGTADAGAVFVIFGSSGLTGLHDLGSTAADYTLYGPAAAAGLQSAAVGKVDGGSQVDLVARTTDKAYVIFGPISAGTRHLGTTPADITITGLQAGGVAVLDITGDGQDDLVLGSADKVYILPGPLPAGTYAVGTVSGLITLTGVADAVAKDEVFAVGNVVGDSKPDLIIGSHTLKRAFVIAGGTSLSGTIAVADVSAILVKSAVLKNLGYDVTSGDLDNDGRPDLIVSTQFQNVTNHDISEPKFDDAGIIYVIYGK